MLFSRTFRVLPLLLGFTTARSVLSVNQAAQNTSDICATPLCKDIAGTILSGLAKNHRQLDPCADFDAYVCNGWRDTHDFEPDQSIINSMSALTREHQKLLRSIVEGSYDENFNGSSAFSAEQRTANKENFQKLKVAYDTCMNEDAIKAAGVAPLTKLIDEFEKVYPRAGSSVGTKDELTKALIWLAKNSATGLFSAGASPDNKVPDVVILTFGSTSLGLPKEQYNRAAIVANLTRTVGDMLQVLKTGKPFDQEPLAADTKSELRIRADKLIQFEKTLAAEVASPEKARVIDYSYNAKPLSDIDSLVPEISFTDFIKAMVPVGYGITPARTAVVRDSDYYSKLSMILRSTSRETLHDFFQWRLISSHVGGLHKDFKTPLRKFDNVRSGRDESALPERWRTCIGELDNSLGYLLGAFFIQRTFPIEYKDFGNRIIKEVRDVFTKRFDGFEWMSKEVKEGSAKKVANIRQRVGYQDLEPNNADPVSVSKYYANLTSSTSYFDQQLAYQSFRKTILWNSLLKPTDFNRFEMTPPTVNAYFSATFNSINFPAGVLQIPFFSPDLPEYVSYGSFGSVAGHELTHAFDKNGARYDERGALRDWWDNGTRTRFEGMTECFVAQYNNYTVTDEEGKPLHVNGKLTLGENIADAGGVSSAYAAWRLRETIKKNQGLPGLEHFTNNQLFFLNMAARRCGKARPAEAVKRILTDPHSPNQFRIIGTLDNVAGFKEAFNCPNKKPTCEIW